VFRRSPAVPQLAVQLRVMRVSRGACGIQLRFTLR